MGRKRRSITRGDLRRKGRGRGNVEEERRKKWKRRGGGSGKEEKG